MSKPIVEENKNEIKDVDEVNNDKKHEKFKKIYLKFADKINTLRLLLVSKTKNYDYMRNCFNNKEDGDNYSIKTNSNK